MPRDLGYAAALLRIVHDNPALAQDNGVMHWWAAYRFPNDYRQFSGQEFKLQPILQQAESDLSQTLAQTDSGRVTFTVGLQFGTYDFKGQQFPISMGNGNSYNLNPSVCCVSVPQAAQSIALKVEDLDSITGLPMDSASARSFEEKRTRFGSVDRSITIALTVKLDGSGFAKDAFGNQVGKGVLESAAFLADQRATQPLYVLAGPDLERMRTARAAAKAEQAKAEEARQADIRKQQLLAQRNQNIQMLTNATPSVRLANWISDDEVNTGRTLDSLRSARLSALMGGKAVNVSMLVQADASGRAKIATKWPSHLEITLADGQADLKSSGWYLVRGLLNVPEDDALPPAELMAQAVYACAQPKCADAADPTGIVDRKLEALHAAK